VVFSTAPFWHIDAVRGHPPHRFWAHSPSSGRLVPVLGRQNVHPPRQSFGTGMLGGLPGKAPFPRTEARPYRSPCSRQQSRCRPPNLPGDLLQFVHIVSTLHHAAGNRSVCWTSWLNRIQFRLPRFLSQQGRTAGIFSDAWRAIPAIGYGGLRHTMILAATSRCPFRVLSGSLLFCAGPTSRR